MIRFQSVSKKYPSGPRALVDVSFEIERGEYVLLTGASGAGKSTLLKLVYREELPDEGSIRVGGRNVVELPRRRVPFLRRGIGVVFQSFRLIPRKTVFENVAYLPRILGKSPADQQSMVERALRRVGLAHRLNAFPQQLSGGEQQRVTLARALVCHPRILLADEPTGNLDPEISEEILDLLDEINEGGTTVVLATHDKRILDSMSRRVLLLHRGRLASDTTGLATMEGDPSPATEESAWAGWHASPATSLPRLAGAYAAAGRPAWSRASPSASACS
ncbi:MAG: cell division ATP-binding protein FtsE [Acidobacteriota bacterium]|nr:cell division ATP-binding protein FtsE [Acidobacteriota bacterium]